MDAPAPARPGRAYPRPPSTMAWMVSLAAITFLLIPGGIHPGLLPAAPVIFILPALALAGTMVQEIPRPQPGTMDRLLMVVFALTIILSIATAVFIIGVPKEGERFTEFFITGEKGMAGDYPTVMIPGKNYSVSIGIINHEDRPVNYTVEIWAMLLANDKATNSSRLASMDLLTRFHTVVFQNETRMIPYNLSVKKTGYNQIGFLLFQEMVPDNSLKGTERINASYRNLRLWVNVTPASR
jgi:uncharacterized membrane protein